MIARFHAPESVGFTLIEMLITLALAGLLAIVSLPLYEVTTTRLKEAELRRSLRVIRGGIDAYKAAVDAGTLSRQPGDSGYPPSLEILTEPLEIANQSNSGFGGTDAPQHFVILRQLPRDPFAEDNTLPAAKTWRSRAYGSRSDDPESGVDVFDVSSMSQRIALDGTPYASW